MSKRILRTLFVVACIAAAGAMECGEARAEPLKITVTKPHPEHERHRWFAKQFICMRDTVYTESRGEPVLGQLLVALVLKERAAENRRYWGGDTLCGAAYAVSVAKSGILVSQFSGPIHHPVVVPESDWELVRTEDLVQQVIYGLWEPPPQFACVRYYLNTDTADPSRAAWFKKLRFAGKVGKHSFYCD